MATCDLTGKSVSYAYKLGCRCVACRAWKSYHVSKDTKAAVRSKEWRLANTERSRENSKRYQKNNPDKVLEVYLRRYGLTPAAYQELLTTCEGKCMICGGGRRGLSNGRKLHVDHCHETGKVRGLLCGACNVGLGHFDDNLERLDKAMKYLRKNGDV